MQASSGSNQIFYHGSNHIIKNFNFENVNAKNINEAGPGIYFSSSKKDASMYGKYIYQVTIKITKRRILPEKKNFTPNFVRQLIKKSPDLDDILLDWAEDPKIALNTAVDSIFNAYGPNQYKKVMDTIWYDFFKGREEIWLELLRTNGWDGFLTIRTTDVTHFICYNTDTIKDFTLV